MGHTVAADYIATQVVSLSESELELRPARHIVGSVADLKGEVPHYASVRLLRLVCVLAHAAFRTLDNRKGEIRTDFNMAETCHANCK